MYLPQSHALLPLQIIVAEGAVSPLVSIASYADDMHKLAAMNALDVLDINNPTVHSRRWLLG